jgi:phosphoribosylanthranilate isomerase
MALKLKICGMKFPKNILEVSQSQPNFLGFIFYDKSPRNFKGEIPDLPKEIKKVGVFVNASFEEIIQKAKQHKLDFIQLHGNESPEFCNEIQSEIPVIKAFSIEEGFDFGTLNEYQNSCDYFLFDTKGKNHGGNGITFDWKLLGNYKFDKKYFLSGGISLENTKELLDFLKTKSSENCFAIDINSQFEIEPGLKNTKKITEFKSKL